MQIREIQDAVEKKNICESIVNELSEWFDLTGKKEYPDGVKATLFFACFESGVPIGFIAVKENNVTTSELYVFGVLKKYQRKGVGQALLNEVCVRLVQEDRKLLAVKTLDESAKYEPYNRTRKFYLKNGFLPVGCYDKIWDKENPCLIMVKLLV